jgi:hypothetical protein
MKAQDGGSCSLAEAAVAVGRAESTIRFWLQKKLIAGRKEKDGAWSIDRNSLLFHAATAEPLRPQRPIRGAAAHSVAPAAADRSEEQLRDVLREQVSMLAGSLDHERRISEELRTQNRELQSQLVKIAAEMQAILSRDSDGKLSRWFRR